MTTTLPPWIVGQRAHLSPIVLTDFAQLAPDRTLVVTHEPQPSTNLKLPV
jgi:hypothetical protein